MPDQPTGGGLLEAEGLFLPEEHQGEIELETSHGSGAALAVGVGLVAACAMMAIGAGGTLTWIGAGLAMILYVVFAWVASRSIEAQSSKVDELMEASPPTR